jgi:signal peptidase II
LFFDLLTKKIVKSSFNWGESKKVIGDFFKLTYIENSGIAFGIFSGISHESILKNLIFLLVTLGAVVFIIYLIRQSQKTLPLLGLYFILGGALGNIVERTFGYILYHGEFKIFYGRVVDFFNIGIGEHRWPFFNVADSFITVGVILLVIYTLFFEKKEEKSENA